MPSILLGTGASEAIPCGFCDCPVCRYAREHAGHDVRTRSDFLIDETAIIDFSPDLFSQLLQCKIHLRQLRHIFITHFHEDHVCVPEMGCRNSGTPALTEPVTVYGSAAALEQIQLLFERYKDHTHENAHNYFAAYCLKPLMPFTEYLIDGLKVTPILSSHYGYGLNEIGYNYIITTREGTTFLYAVDTGWYSEETWTFLKSIDKPLDFAVMECTYGDYVLPKHQEGHLDLSNLKEMVEDMGEIGIIDRTTPVYLTHICHLHTLHHEKTQELVSSFGWNIQVGYDGMVIPERSNGYER